jgi:hypothetical protein
VGPDAVAINGILTGTPPPLAAARSDLPADVPRIIGCTLEKDAAASASELVNDLKSCQLAPAKTSAWMIWQVSNSTLFKQRQYVLFVFGKQ